MPGPETVFGRRKGLTWMLYSPLGRGCAADVSGANVAGKIVVPSKGEIPDAILGTIACSARPLVPPM